MVMGQNSFYPLPNRSSNPSAYYFLFEAQSHCCYGIFIFLMFLFFCTKSSFLCELDKKNYFPRISSDVHKKRSISSFFWKKHWKSIFFNKSTNTERNKERNFLLKMFAIKAVALKCFFLNSHSSERKRLWVVFIGGSVVNYVCQKIGIWESLNLMGCWSQSRT